MREPFAWNQNTFIGNKFLKSLKCNLKVLDLEEQKRDFTNPYKYKRTIN